MTKLATLNTIADDIRGAFLAHMHHTTDIPMDELIDGYASDDDAFRCDYDKYREDVDARTDSQRGMDKLVGNKKTTLIDKLYGKVKRSATEILGNKATIRHLTLGYDAFTYVETWVSSGGKRKDATSRLVELLIEDGVPASLADINDNIGVYALAKLITGEDAPADMKGFASSVAYRTLRRLKVAVKVKDGEAAFKDGWADFARTAIHNGLIGTDLDKAIESHQEYLKSLENASARKGLTPEAVANMDRAKLNAEREKKIGAFNKSAEKVLDAAKDAGFSPDDILTGLINRGVISDPLTDVAGFANSLDVNGVIRFGELLIARGNDNIIMALSSVLCGYLDTHKNLNSALPAKLAEAIGYPTPETANA